jgi:release factor glutamine methyltransferase
MTRAELRPGQVVRRAAGYLAHHGVEGPLSSAELLMASVLGTDRTGIYLREEPLSAPDSRRFGRALCLRCAGSPVQHLTGEQSFRRLSLRVRSGVFIPRPETEIVAGAALESIAGIPEPVVVDLGTGTGALALAVASEHPGARVFATDRSAEAVTLARENAGRLGLVADIYEGDLFGPLPAALRGTVDLVVTNPPYLEPEEFDELPVDVRADPRPALIGGLAIFDRLVPATGEWLRRGGAFVTEIGETQGPAVSAACRRAGFTDVRTSPDLAGRDRVVAARKP